MISTRKISTLKIRNEKGIEIESLGNQITGMDGDEFVITLEGVAYRFYEEEFPHHVKAYKEMF